VTSPRVTFDRARVDEFLRMLEMMAAGNTRGRLSISERHDELDAIAHGVNVLVGELGWAAARLLEAQEERAVSAERANVSKNILLRNVSHEVRTPITAMLAIADVLALSETGPEDRPDLLRRLRTNGQAVLRLLEDLLDLARVDAQKIALALEAVPLVECVSDALATLEIDARAKGLEMRLDTSADAIGAICTDRYRLRQILVNLVANAIKFTESGRIVVTVAVSDGDDACTIEVCDTGIGIAPDQQAQLFEPFGQANASIARVYGGVGLGLALSRRLAEQLGGSLVLVRSAPGEGATLASAHDGAEAMSLTVSGTFDVILMDIHLPAVDGLQATRLLRAQGCRVPILALTANPSAWHHTQALEAGCDDCLSKPFKIADVSARVRVAMQRS